MKNKQYKKQISLKAIVSLMWIISIGFAVMSCAKQNEWLDAKINKSSVVPETLADYQALLDNASQTMNSKYSSIGLVGSDNIYINEVNLATLTEVQQNAYLWKDVIYPDDGFGYEWQNLHAIIANANLVLDGLSKLDPAQTGQSNIKGQAHFFRAYAYYNLAQVYCKPYIVETAEVDLGLPLRKSSDVNIIYGRESIKDTYNQIILDAGEAASSLSPNQPYIQRPNNAAAYALLAKAYLNMGDYSNALAQANNALNQTNALLDFNSGAIDLNSANRFGAYGINNPEILFYAETQSYLAVLPYILNPASISQELYDLYEEDDLRRSVFFSEGDEPRFVGSYTGRYFTFCGIANNEVYLIKAECEARLGNYSAAMETLNALLVQRYKHGEFTPLIASNETDALDIILTERRKELPLVSNIRWEDLRRLNKETRYQKTLTRNVGGSTYTLEPNDVKYVLPIPNQEIILSGIQQNER